jgi:hypothetical protein
MSPGRRERALSTFGHHRLTRRALITTGLGLGAAVRARAEEQPAKLSKSAAAYQDTPKGMFSCAACTLFVKPRSCKVVSGDISPTGWCKLFDLAD